MSNFDPRWALVDSGFVMTDLVMGQNVETVRRPNIQRGPHPPLRVRGCHEKQLVLTLLLETPVKFAHDFSRSRRPQPWSVVKLDKRIDDQGRPVERTQASVAVSGVDGLEPGHECQSAYVRPPASGRTGRRTKRRTERSGPSGPGLDIQGGLGTREKERGPRDHYIMY